jgi:hypothetical protein
MSSPTCRSSSSNHNRGGSVLSPLWILFLALWGWSFTADAAATPMTWQYIGSITSSPDESVLTVGTPVTFQVTVDPEANVLVGSAIHPPWAGQYFMTLGLDFAGLHYDLNGAFEVNMDTAFLQPLPGQILLRQIRWTGPDLFGHRVGTPCFASGPPCLYFLSFGANASSPALPMPLDRFGFLLPFDTNPQFVPGVYVGILGHDPQLVPELSSLALVGTGVLGLTLIRRRECHTQYRPPTCGVKVTHVGRCI